MEVAEEQELIEEGADVKSQKKLEEEIIVENERR